FAEDILQCGQCGLPTEPASDETCAAHGARHSRPTADPGQTDQVGGDGPMWNSALRVTTSMRQSRRRMRLMQPFHWAIFGASRRSRPIRSARIARLTTLCATTTMD